jgi:hypothetical protein
MKKFLYCSLLFAAITATAQKNDRGFGLTAGINEYFAKPDFLSSKSAMGFSFGFVGGFDITKNSDLVFEGGFTRFNMKFMGMAIGEDDPRWLNFHSNRIFLNALYYYDLFHFNDNKLLIGVHAGPSVTYINNFTVEGKDNANFNLEPYEVSALDMKISKYTDGAEFNAFATLGINVKYLFCEMNLRYNKGLSSPYRSLGNENSPVSFKGKDDYMSLSFTFFIKQ